MKNGLSINLTLDLPILSNVRIQYKKGGWTGPYKLLSTSGETCTIDMLSGATNFRSTIVKPYYVDENEEISIQEDYSENEKDEELQQNE